MPEIEQSKKEKVYKIALMGSAFRDKEIPADLAEKSQQIGREIARNNCILVTGSCMGLPHEAVLGASEEGGMILGFSPAANLKEHIDPPLSYPHPPKGMTLIYTEMGREGRTPLLVRNCDAVIFVRGSVGTLIEFSLAYHMGKIVGVLEGTGRVSEQIPEIFKNIGKDTGTVLILEPDPKTLVKKVIEALNSK